MTDPRIPFRTQLDAGAKLCLLPLSRVKAESLIELGEELVLYPRGTLQPDDLRIVSYPAHEWREAERRGVIMTPGAIVAEGEGLAWLKSAATHVEIEDFFENDLLALPVVMNWEHFLGPATHEDHLDMIASALGQAEAVLDLVRFTYCNPVVSGALPGRAGFLPRQGFTAALFYALDDHESYIVAGEIVTHHLVAGIGLELDSVSSVPTLADGEVGGIARHGLRLHSMALEAADDTAKFVQYMTLIDFLAEPDAFIGMQVAKKRIGRHVARDRAEYDAIMEDFKFLTSEGGKPGPGHRGLRHNIFHLGRQLEDLLPRAERHKVLRRLDRYVGVPLQHLIERSDQTWADIVEFRRRRGVELGLEPSS